MRNEQEKVRGGAATPPSTKEGGRQKVLLAAGVVTDSWLRSGSHRKGGAQTWLRSVFLGLTTQKGRGFGNAADAPPPQSSTQWGSAEEFRSRTLHPGKGMAVPTSFFSGQ